MLEKPHEFVHYCRNFQSKLKLSPDSCRRNVKLKPCNERSPVGKRSPAFGLAVLIVPALHSPAPSPEALLPWDSTENALAIILSAY